MIVGRTVMPSRDPAAVRRGKEIIAPIEVIRKYTLRSLLDDLADLEREGLSEESCFAVQNAMQKLANAASEIPDGSFFQGTVLKEVEQFSDIYTQWNGYTGPGREVTKSRRSALKKLRKRRQRIARRIHLNQHVLENHLDLQLIEATHVAFKDLVVSAPKLFRNLARSLERMAIS
jgi:hypothetical protein